MLEPRHHCAPQVGRLSVTLVHLTLEMTTVDGRTRVHFLRASSHRKLMVRDLTNLSHEIVEERLF